MKTQFPIKLNLFKRWIVVLSVLLTTVKFENLAAQTITRDDGNNDATDFVCPVSGTSYTINVSNTAYTNCTRKWVATGGQINGADDGLSVTVSWAIPQMEQHHLNAHLAVVQTLMETVLLARM